MSVMKTISAVLFIALLGCNKDNLQPNLIFMDEAFGCSSFMVYRINNKDDLSIAVIGNRHSLNLNSSEQGFNLSNVNGGDLKVEVRQFSKNAKLFYCNDVPSEAGDVISTWTSTQGSVMASIAQDSLWVNQIGDYEYKISLTIQDVQLKNEKGMIICVNYLEFKDVYVGWLPG